MNRIQTALFLMWMIGIPIVIYLFIADRGPCCYADVFECYCGSWYPIIALVLFSIMFMVTFAPGLSEEQKVRK